MKKIILISCIFMLVIVVINYTVKKSNNNITTDNVINNKIIDMYDNYSVSELNNQNQYDNSVESNDNNINEINDWRLILVNQDNYLPSDFEPELANIDKIRKFDIRAIEELKQMVDHMKKDKISDVWIQSSYRSVAHQEEIFNNKIDWYMQQGESREEAERLTLQTINKPGTSEHNLGLAIDFNYVNYNFDQTKGFKWLKDNAENYGFVLRYDKEKEDITKVIYEPWHWRYVGKENAIKMNELNMCLEEYIEYLSK